MPVSRNDNDVSLAAEQQPIADDAVRSNLFAALQSVYNRIDFLSIMRLDRGHRRQEAKAAASMTEAILGDELQGPIYEKGVSPGTTNGAWVFDARSDIGNLSGGLPFYSISAAYFVNNRPIVAAVLDPIHNELWSAGERGGAVVNGKSLKCSYGRSNIAFSSVTSSEFNPDCNNLSLGSLALELCFLADNRADWLYRAPGQYSIAAIASGVLIAEEAGALAATAQGGEDAGHGEQGLLIAAPDILGRLLA